ncbi:Protein of unknown function [Methylobacterium phyllostachyos]|uniref:DUF3987 domain-containing protein n=1 Tax=Methylobacterium phyllostachyos TaxID=582672 RepID=A0A1G9S0G4_9HYPH|nr:DUF3987 domain-containing protein [Methylobacterium phyllostachyos]SDM28912.1 Protein of unknown function [Methylobacterium phyllostachyos]
MTSIEAPEPNTPSIFNFTSYPYDAPEYPVNALGPVSGLARSLAEALQVPLALVAQNILGLLSFATQGLANVQTPLTASSPLSLCLVTTVESQPRKRLLQSILSSELILYQKDLQNIQMRTAKEETPSTSTKSNNDTHKSVLGCIFLPREQQISSIFPNIRYYPSTILFNSDNLSQFIAKGGQKYTSSQSSATQHLDDLWSGEDIVQITKSTTEIISNYRCTFNLSASEDQVVELFNIEYHATHALLSKALIAAPEKIIGQRSIKELKPNEIAGLNDFHSRCIELLLQIIPSSEQPSAGPSLRLLKLQRPERGTLIDFMKEIEAHSGPEGFFSKIQAFSENAAEHVCRLAGVLQLYDNPLAETISGEMLNNAMALFSFYAIEAYRIQDLRDKERQLPEELVLLKWLLEKSKKMNGSAISEPFRVRYVRQNTKPQFRNIEKLLEIIKILEAKHYVDYDADKKLISLRVSELPKEM